MINEKTSTNPGITWKTTKIFVDLDTGEIISEKKAKAKYILIKITRNYVREIYSRRGTVISTHECRRNNQLTLFT